jgi:hypothetical protein
LYKAGFQKTGLFEKIWPREIAGLVTGLEWLGGCECVKKVKKENFSETHNFYCCKSIVADFLIG